MGGVGAEFSGRAERLHQALAVIRKLEDGVAEIVYHPDVLFGIVGVDVDGVGALDHGIPLRPAFGDVALRIHDDDVVFPPRVHAHAAFPVLLGIFGKLPRPAAARKRRDRSLRCVAERHLGGGKREAGTELRHGGLGRPRHDRQFAALRDEHAVGALGEHAFDSAPAPALVPGQLRHRPGPIAHHVIRAG